MSSVPDVLQTYANRGLFRDFHAQSGKAGGDFGFVWMGHRPMNLKWKTADRTVVFKDVFPNVPARGEMYREIRAYLQSRTDAELPDHRRVDPAEFELMCVNRGGNVSIGLKVIDGNEAAATDKLMLLIHETYLFMTASWLDYVHEEFGASLE